MHVFYKAIGLTNSCILFIFVYMVYFIEANKRIKIGYTENPTQRISDIQVSSPYKINVLLLINGTVRYEKLIHKKFKPYRLRGEWFSYNKNIIEYINNLKIFDRRADYGLCETICAQNEQLKQIRKKCNLSLKDIAQILNITPQSAYDAEQREKNGTISINTISKIAKSIGYKLEYKLILDETGKNYIKKSSEMAENYMYLKDCN